MCMEFCGKRALWGSTIWRYISYWKWGFSNVMLVFRGVPSKKIHMKHHALPNLDSAGPTWRASLLEPRCAFRLARLPVCGCSGTIKTLTTIQNTIHVDIPSRELTYCWWKKSCTCDVSNPVNHGTSHLSTGAGFLPSTVSHLWKRNIILKETFGRGYVM